MKGNLIRLATLTMMAGAAAALLGCRGSMPHSFTWPYSGDQVQSHPKPPEGGYYTNWDPYAVSLEVTPLEDVNPVRTQHVLVATVRDKDGKALPNRRVEWILSRGDNAVGEIVEVDESGWRASRGYKVDNLYAVSHTNNGPHVLDRGNDDPSDDVTLEIGQTWCVITSPVEGDTYITAYAPGIYDWGKHKVFAVKHWYDIKWECPPPSTNPVGTTHDFVTRITKYSDGTFLPNHSVTYTIMDGPDATFDNGTKTQTVMSDANGVAKVTIKQTTPAKGTNNIGIEIMRPENTQCCMPAVKIATCSTSKTWVQCELTLRKECTPSAVAGDPVNYTITVNNPSQADANNVTVTDNIPDGISYVSSTPAASGGGPNLSWSLGTLKAGQSMSIQVQAKAGRTGRYENCAEARADQCSARDCCTTVVTSPQLALEKQCPAEVMLCDPFDYTIIVKNTGDGVARNVKIDDQLPDGLATTNGRNAVASAVGDLQAGEAKQLRFSVKANRTGSFTNRAVASGDGGLSAEASCTTVVKQPQLQVTKAGPDIRYIGRPADYQITVRNSGDSSATNTVLTDPIPAGTQFVSASDGGSFSGGRVTWNLGTLEPGGTRTVSLQLKAVTAGSAKNVATATANCAEGQAQTEMKITGIPAVLLEVVDEADPIEVGQNETYTIVVTNQGSAEDTNIKIVCEIPPQMEFVSAGGATPGNSSGRTVTFDALPRLGPKERATWKVVAKGINTAGNDTADVRFKTSMMTDQTTQGGVVEETESTHIYE